MHIRIVLGILSVIIGALSYSLMPENNDNFYVAVYLRLSLSPLYFLLIIIHFFVIDTFFEKRKYWFFIITTLVLIVTGSFIADTLRPFTDEELAQFSLPAHFLGIIFVITGASYLRMIKDKLSRKAELNEFKARQTETDLKLLRQQINPHFLFNTLQSIYLKCIQDGPEAGDMIMKLSDMLRYQLETDKLKKIPLRKELDFIEQYVFFEKRRLPANITVNYSMDVNDDALSIVPNLLITPIENTFKHGVPSGQNAAIDISISLNNNVLTLTTENVLAENKSSKTPNVSIDNLRKQLEFLYHNKHTFQMKKINGKYFSTLEIIL